MGSIQWSPNCLEYESRAIGKKKKFFFVKSKKLIKKKGSTILIKSPIGFRVCSPEGQLFNVLKELRFWFELGFEGSIQSFLVFVSARKRKEWNLNWGPGDLGTLKKCCQIFKSSFLFPIIWVAEFCLSYCGSFRVCASKLESIQNVLQCSLHIKEQPQRIVITRQMDNLPLYCAVQRNLCQSVSKIEPAFDNSNLVGE